MTNHTAANCKAKDPSTCRFHGSSHETQLDDAVQAKNFSSFVQAKEVQTSRSNFINDDKFRNVKKMPALFVIDRTKYEATEVINEAGAWIFDEPARATIKR